MAQAISGRVRDLEESVGEAYSKIHTLQETVHNLEDSLQALQAQMIEVLARGNPDSNATSVTSVGYNKELWKSANVVSMCIKKKLSNLNKALSSGKQDSKLRIDPNHRESMVIGKEIYAVCIACFRAGHNPERCLHQGPLHNHRKPGCCENPLQQVEVAPEKRVGTCANKTKHEGASVLGVDFALVRIPGIYYITEFEPCGTFDGEAVKNGKAVSVSRTSSEGRKRALW